MSVPFVLIIKLSASYSAGIADSNHKNPLLLDNSAFRLWLWMSPNRQNMSFLYTNAQTRRTPPRQRGCRRIEWVLLEFVHLNIFLLSNQMDTLSLLMFVFVDSNIGCHLIRPYWGHICNAWLSYSPPTTLLLHRRIEPRIKRMHKIHKNKFYYLSLTPPIAVQLNKNHQNMVVGKLEKS